ncbi:putative cytokinetic ring protein SteA [Evansella tamaricis]|uniref:Thiamin pyrophosphokinase n=1 Tax=Evansella tamaricis TaxID=2069301 RepID=A0ABS6JM04_9BACI|nr:putative cytokinetic ring protein SteA [Evansella tamaricis]MBU9714688.1 hypothetical protein [Evansella tamaricis]
MNRIKGEAYFGKSTKKLLHIIPKGAIIILEHEDIDIVAAEEMVRKGVKAVINTKISVTGKIPRSGVDHLLHFGIPVFDLDQPKMKLGNLLDITVIEDKLFQRKGQDWVLVGDLVPYTLDFFQKKISEGRLNYPELYKHFVANSFNFAEKEMELFLKFINQLPILPEIKGKNVFIIARGASLEEDIRMARPLLKNPDCVVLAVDGASVLLSEYNIKPEYIIGDMDSIPEDVTKYQCRFISHSYLNGTSPGQERLKKLSIESEAIPFPGLSEDLAIMLAYVSQAQHIYTIGCRTSVVELVEKGRKGMGSTLLTRMYVGDKVSDIKQIHRLVSLSKIPFFYDQSMNYDDGVSNK